MYIKLLPSHYILKRWTREATYETIQDNQGRSIIANPKLDAMLRYKSMSHKFQNLAYQAASFPECCLLVDNVLDCLGKQLQEKMSINISASPSNLSDSYIVHPEAQQDEDMLTAARLKKKEVQQKKIQSDIDLGSTRHKSTQRKCQINLVYVAENSCNILFVLITAC